MRRALIGFLLLASLPAGCLGGQPSLRSVIVMNHGSTPVVVQVADVSWDAWKVGPGKVGPGIEAPNGTHLWVYDTNCALIAEAVVGSGFIDVTGDRTVRYFAVGDIDLSIDYQPRHGCPGYRDTVFSIPQAGRESAAP